MYGGRVKSGVGSSDLRRPSREDLVRRDTTSRQIRVLPFKKADGVEEEVQNGTGDTDEKGSGGVGCNPAGCSCSVRDAALTVWPHLKIVLLNVAYLGFGAWVFCTLECEGQKARHPDLPASRHLALDKLRAAANNTTSFENWTKIADMEMTRHEEMVVRARQEFVWGTNGSSPAYLSDPSRAVFFAASVVTTIGYGHVTPQTTGGRVFLMFYALFGMPLMLAWLADINRLLGRLLHFLAGKINSVVRPELPDDKARRLPVWVIVLLLVIYLLVGAGVLCFWEDWTFIDSLYFTYITASTIGFGDIVPTKQLYVLVVFPYILLGLSLVSNCFRLNQEAAQWVDERFCGGRRVYRRDACPCCGLLSTQKMRPEDLVLVRRVALKWRRKSAHRKRAVVYLLPMWMVWDDLEEEAQNQPPTDSGRTTATTPEQ
ncbi:KCNK3 [Branchiostoma lanceolatum]|uniref:KCNK3 protein n=1 Tax=Branchiostoma lanceolatum TaxID=7740 RepID=A0A8J9ZLE0_BRALA|nr:KCNK3 [Branchiostoma lanceolatum]